MIINLGCASVDNHIPRDDIFDHHPLKNVIFIYYNSPVGGKEYISHANFDNFDNVSKSNTLVKLSKLFKYKKIVIFSYSSVLISVWGEKKSDSLR